MKYKTAKYGTMKAYRGVDEQIDSCSVDLVRENRLSVNAVNIIISVDCLTIILSKLHQ